MAPILLARGQRTGGMTFALLCALSVWCLGSSVLSSPIVPQYVPGPPDQVFISADNDSALRVQFLPPENVRAEGVNGAPVLGYKVDIAQRVNEVQTFTVAATGPIMAGGYKMRFFNAWGDYTTACIRWNASELEFEMALEELPNIDSVSVTRSPYGTVKNGYTYAITFDGDYLANGPQPNLVAGDDRGCLATEPANRKLTFDNGRITTGVTGHYPEVVQITSYDINGSNVLSGSFDLSIGYEGSWVIVNNVQASIVPGSKTATISGAGMVGKVNRGDLVKIGNDVFTVHASAPFTNTKLPLTSNHELGASNASVYVQDTALGDVSVSHGNTAVGTSIDLSASILQNEHIMIGGWEFLVFAVTSTSITLGQMDSSGPASWPGSDQRHITAYKKKKVTVSATIDAEKMTEELSKLPGVGSVRVSRFGPTRENGFKWLVTFSSLGGPSNCPYAPCFVADNVTGSQVWLRDVYGQVCTDCKVNAAVVKDVTLNRTLFGIAGDFTPTSIVGSRETGGGVYEVQSIATVADADDIAGSFLVNFQNTFGEYPGVAVNFGDTAGDVQTRLQSLPSVGRVNVTVSSNANYGVTWMVTFASNMGDQPLFLVNPSNLQGTNAQVRVSEVIKGYAVAFEATMDGLIPSQRYFARAFARNVNGYGAGTTTLQPEGRGVLPFISTVASAPAAPTIVAQWVVSESQMQFRFNEPESHGARISRYLVEYAVGDSFGSPAVQQIYAYNSLENDIDGTFRLQYGNDVSPLLPIHVTAQGLQNALNRLPTLRRVTVSRALCVLTGVAPSSIVSFSASNNQLTAAQPLEEFQRSLLVAGALIDVNGTKFVVQNQPPSGSSTIVVQAGHGATDYSSSAFPLLKVDSSGNLAGPSGYQWQVTFSDDVEHELSQTYPSLKLISSLRSVELGTSLTVVGISDTKSAVPSAYYGSIGISNDQSACDAYVIGEPSSVQVLQLFAPSTITGGTFKLQLGDEPTAACITLGNANTKSNMQSVLKNLTYVTRATVDEQRKFKVMMLSGSSSSKVVGFDSSTSQVTIVSSNSGGLTNTEAGKLSAGTIFRVSRNPNDFSRDSCEFSVQTAPIPPTTTITVNNPSGCATFNETRALQILDFHDYKIRLWGKYPTGKWPTLQLVPKSADGCAAPWTPAAYQPDVYGVVHSIGYEGACATGRRGTQTILAEAETTIGGSFIISYQGKESPALSFQGTSASVMRDAIDAITAPGTVNVTLSQYGTYGRAWHITFTETSEQDDVIFIKHSRLTGKNVAISIYDTVQIYTDARENDLRGSFRISFNGEVTEPIGYSATHSKITQELQKLTSIDSVVALGDTRNGDIGVYALKFQASVNYSDPVLTQIMLDNAAIDPTRFFAVRETLDISGTSYVIQSLTPVDITLSQAYQGSTNASADVLAGLITKQVAALPGKIGITSVSRVITATFNSNKFQFSMNHGLVSNNTFVLGGNMLTVDIVTGNTVYTTANYNGLDIVNAVPETYIFDNWLRTTRDWTNLISVNDYLWIRSNSVDMVRYTVLDVRERYIQVEGEFSRDILAGTAYHASNGRQWNLAFRSYVGDLASLDVIPGNDFRGTRARIGSHGSSSMATREVTVGNPAATQTILLEAADPSDVGPNAKYNLEFNGELTADIAWNETGLSGGIKLALESLDSVDGVTVVSRAYLNGYVHAISFWGTYPMRKLPLLKVTVTVAHPSNVNAWVSGNQAVATSKHENLILKDTEKFIFRMSAVNAKGISETGQQFASERLGTSFIPTVPTSVSLGEFHGSTWLSVNYRPPLYSGGAPITMYRLEWDSSPTFDSSSRDYGVATIQKRYEVQHVTTIYRSDTGAGGTFTLSWGGRTTTPLPFDCSQDAMVNALAIITGTIHIAVDPVKIERVQASWGYTWKITFQHNPGDLAPLVADGRLLLGDFPRIRVREVVDGFNDIAIGDFTREVQDVFTDSVTKLSGSFQLEFEAKVTDAISASATALEMQQALQAITTLYSIKVSKSWRSVPLNNAIWSVTFAYLKGEETVGAGNVFIMQPRQTASLVGSAASVRVVAKISGSDPFQYSITGLRPGVRYYMHAMAYNEDGFGSATSPLSTATTCGQPDPPDSVTASVKSGTELTVQWSSSSFDGGCPVSKYKVEWFRDPGSNEEQTITTSAGKGLPEIQRLTNFASSQSLTGYFKLSFQGETTENIAWNAPATGPASVKERLERMSSVGSVAVSRGVSRRVIIGLLVTVVSGTVSLATTPVIQFNTLSTLTNGSTIWIADYELLITSVDTVANTFIVTPSISVDVPVPVFTSAFGYSWDVTFLSGHIGPQPLLQVSSSDNWGGNSPGLYVESTQKGLQPISGTFRLSFASGVLSDTTPSLPYNASASAMKDALQNLVTVGLVNVTRFVNGYGYNWGVTFLSELANDMSLLIADDSQLHGPSVRMFVSRTNAGVQPSMYCEKNGVAGSPVEIGVPGTLQYDLSGLVTGQKYGIRVRASNQEGYGGAAYILPSFQIPRSKPTAPTKVQLMVLSSHMLKVLWTEPISNGGSSITSYLVQWDTSSTFATSTSPNYDMQASLVVEPGASSPFYLNIPVLTFSSYYVRVFAVNDQGSSGATQPVPPSVAPIDRTPGKVEDAVAVVLSSYAILVTWTASSIEKTYFGGDGGLPITQYMIEWDSSSRFDSPAAFGLVDGKARSYIIGGDDPVTGVRSDLLVMNTEYYIRISAFNAQGAGKPQVTVPASVVVKNQPPSAPQDLILKVASSTSANAQWNNPLFDGGASLKSYQIEWDEQSDFSSGASSSATIPIVREMQSMMIQNDVVNEEQFIDATVEVTNEEQMVRTVFTGVDEVQVIETNNSIVRDEIQSVITTAQAVDEIIELRLTGNDINEIQAIQTSVNNTFEVHTIQVGAQRIPEVQTITLALSGAAQDSDRLNINGTIAFTFDNTICTYCTLTRGSATTGNLLEALRKGAATQDQTDSAKIVKDALEGLSNIDFVNVSRTEAVTNQDLTVTFSITFSGDSVVGNVAQIKIDSNLYFVANSTTTVQYASLPTLATRLTPGNEVTSAVSSVFNITYTCGSYTDPYQISTNSLDCTPTSGDMLCPACVTGFDAPTQTFSVSTDLSGTLTPLILPKKLIAGNCSFEASAVTQTTITFSPSDVGVGCSSFSTSTAPIPLYYAKQRTVSIPLKTSSTVPTPGSNVEGSLNGILGIGSVTVSGTTTITDVFVGSTYAVTFKTLPGRVPLLSCDKTSIQVTGTGAAVCDVTRTTMGSSISGTFTVTIASELYPSVLSTTAPIWWDATSEDVKSALQSVQYLNEFVFGQVNVVRSVYSPAGTKWSGGFTWQIEFTSRRGNVPTMTASASGLVDAASNTPTVLVEDYTHQFTPSAGSRDGNQVSGNMTFQFGGITSDPYDIDSHIRPEELEGQYPDNQLRDFLVANMSGKIPSLTVMRSAATQARGFTWTITFSDPANGGDVEDMKLPLTQLTGVNATAVFVETRKGNQLGGTFQLSFLGETTGPILFDADKGIVENQLNSLSSIMPSSVVVNKSGPFGKVLGYRWDVTFRSSTWVDPTSDHSTMTPGNWQGPRAKWDDVWPETKYSKAWGRQVGPLYNNPSPIRLVCIKDSLTTSAKNDHSQDCAVNLTQDGIGPIRGDFKIQLDSSSTAVTNHMSVKTSLTNFLSASIAHNAFATRAESGASGASVEEILEAMPNVGDVAVTRSDVDKNTGCYAWTVTFLRDADGPCEEVEYSSTGARLCNSPGDVPSMTTVPSLIGDNPTVSVCVAGAGCHTGVVQDGQILRGRFTAFQVQGDPGVAGRFFLSLPSCSATPCQSFQIFTIHADSSASLSTYLLPNDAFTLDDHTCVFTVQSVSNTTVTLPAGVTCPSMNSGNTTKMGISIRVPWNAGADLVERVLEASYGGRKVSVERTVQGKYGEMSWQIRFISNPGFTPPGAGNVPDIVTSFVSETGDPVPDPDVTEVTQGSDGLSGSFTVDFHSTIGPRTVAFDEDAKMLERKINEMNTIGRVTVERFQFPASCTSASCSGGWEDLPVSVSGTRGGYRWRVRFMRVTGEYGGLTFPSGSGNVGPLTVVRGALQGTQRSVDVTTNKPGSSPITGFFELKTLTESTPALQYSASADSIKQGIESMNLYGDVDVTQTYLLTQQIPNAVANVAKDGSSATISSVTDISQYIAPGDIIRFGYVGSDNLVGSNGDWPFTQSLATSKVTVSALSPIVTAGTTASTELLYPGMTLRIDGLVYTVQHSGQEVQTITVTVPSASWTTSQNLPAFKLTLVRNGIANIETTCLVLNAPESDVQTALNTAINTALGTTTANVRVVRSGPQDTGGQIVYVYTIYFRGAAVAGDVSTLQSSTTGCTTPVIPANVEPKVLTHGGEIAHQRLLLATDSGQVIDTGGYFTLTLNALTTSCLKWGLSEDDLETALETSLYTGNVIVTRQGSGESTTEIQRLRMTSNSEVTVGSGGLFQLMFTLDGKTSMTQDCQPYGVAADALQTAINGMSNLNLGVDHINVTRVGDGSSVWGYGYEYFFNFRGPLLGGSSPVLGDMMQIEVVNVGVGDCVPVVGGNPALTIETVRNGAAGFTYDIFFLGYNTSYTPLLALTATPCSNSWEHRKGSVRRAWAEMVALGGSAAVQTITVRNLAGSISGAPSYKLEFAGATMPIASSCLAYNADASTVEAALVGLSTIDTGGVFVSRDENPIDAPNGYIYKITFIGEKVTGDVSSLFSVDSAGGCVAPTGTNEIFVGLDERGGQPPGAFALSEYYAGERPGIHTAYAVSQLFSVMKEQFEIQQVAIVNSGPTPIAATTTTGKYKLTYNSVDTDYIAWDASEVVVQAALTSAITGAVAGDIVVTRRVDQSVAANGYVYTIYFSGDTVAGDLPELTADPLKYTNFNDGNVVVTTIRDGTAGALNLKPQMIPLAQPDNPTAAATYLAGDNLLSVFKVNGFLWTVKFASTIGNIPKLGSRTDELVGGLTVYDDFVQGSASSSYVISPLLPGITYFVHVAASTDIGIGAYSSTASITPSGAPSAVQNIAAGYALYVPEVQEVRLAATHITEIQQITTSAASVPEVQTLQTSADPALCVNHPCVKGSLAFRVPTVQTITIWSRATITAGTFIIQFERWEADPAVPGTFRVARPPSATSPVATTIPLSWKEEASVVQAELVKLDTLEDGDIIVTRDGDGTADYNYGYTFSITFVGNNVAGETLELSAMHTLTGCNIAGCVAFSNGGVGFGIDVAINSGMAMGTDTPVQTVVVGSPKPLAVGSYKLTFDHLGATVSSSCIPFDAPARDDPRSMEYILNHMSNIDKVYVTRVSDPAPGANGFIYTIFFYGNGVYQDINKLDYNFTGCTPFKTQENNMLVPVTGTINITMTDPGGFNATNTFVSATSATAAQLQADLNRLPVFGNVLVSQSLVDQQDGYIWTVAFKDSEGNLPQFICAVDATFTSAQGAKCETDTLTDGNTLSGTFVVESSVPIAFDASAATVKAALEAMQWVKTVQVTRSGPSAQLGYSWTITFLEYLGDVPPLLVTSSLVGTASSIAVAEIRKGNSIGGSFSLKYLDSVTDPIAWNAPAMAVDSMFDGTSFQEKLEALAVVGPLNVVRTGPDQEGGYTWTITFLDSTLNSGDLPLLQANSSLLTGQGVVAFTREVAKGSNAVGDQLWLSFDPPATDNGSPITKYLVRWDVSSSFTTSPGEVFLSDPAVLYQTQRITTRAPNLAWSVAMPLVAMEVQQLKIESSTGAFALTFRGATTSTFTIGFSTGADLQTYLSALPAVGNVTVSPTGANSMTINTYFLITFTEKQGLLPQLQSTTTDASVIRIQGGSTNFRKEVVVFTCTTPASPTQVEFCNSPNCTTVDPGATLDVVEAALISLFATESGGIRVTAQLSQLTLCAASPQEVTITFHQVYGDISLDINPTSAIAIKDSSIDGVYNDNLADKMSGTFQVGYGGDYTRPLNAESTADQVRYALEDLSTVDTVGVVRERSYQPLLLDKVDVVKGQIYVTCSTVAACFKNGTYGLPGYKVRIGGDWYTIRADKTSAAQHPSRLYLGDSNGRETGYKRASETGVTVYEWAKGYVWRATMFKVAQPLQYLRAKVPRLVPKDSTVAISGRSCSKCYYIPNESTNTLTIGQRYYIEVDAINSNGIGASPPGTPVNATPSQVPGPPSNIDLAVVSGKQIEVFFSPPALATTNMSPNFNNDISAYIVQWDVVSTFRHGLPICTNCAQSLAGAVLTVSTNLSSKMMIGTRFTIGDDSCVLQVANSVTTQSIPVTSTGSPCTPFSGRAYALYYYTFPPAVLTGALIQGSPPFRYLINGLTNDTLYYVQVAAVNSVPVQQIGLNGYPPNNRKWSSALSATTKNKVPDPPVSVAVYSFSATTLQIYVQAPTRDGQGTNGNAITDYWIDYDTVSTFDSPDKAQPITVPVPPLASSGSIPELYAGGPRVYLLEGLTNGVRYFVQVKANSNIGLSRATLAPNPVAPTRSSDPPTNVKVMTPTKLVTPIQTATVTWQKPVSNGGLPITSYKIEWWRGTDPGASRPEIQMIELKWTVAPTSTTFALSFGGQLSSALPYNVTPENLRNALMNIIVGSVQVVGHVVVSRTDINNRSGYQWQVTFANTNVNAGDQPLIQFHFVTVDNNAGVTGSISEVTPGVAVPPLITYPGSQEVQVLVVSHTSAAVGGFFRFSFKGSVWSNYVSVTASGSLLKACLEELPTVGKVSVTLETQSSLIPTHGSVWTITFDSRVGNQPAITVDSSKVTPADVFVGVKDGDNAVDSNGALCLPGQGACLGSWTGFTGTGTGVVGAASIGETAVGYQFYETIDANTLTYTITGLTPGATYLVAVTAKNARGLGTRALSSPQFITPPVQAPQPPTNVVVDVNFGVATRLKASWDAPTSDGGSDVWMYRVEFDPSPLFKNRGQQDVWCPTSPTLAVWTIQTARTNPGDAISNGFFSLVVRHNGHQLTTEPIPWNAVASASQEVGGGTSSSDVFCTPCAACTDACASSTTFPLGRRESSGSMQSKLEYLDTVVTSGVQVSRTATQDAGGGYTWTVTFLDPGDFDVQLATNSLACASDFPTNSMCSNATYKVTTTQLTAGIENPMCTGPHVVPAVGALNKGQLYYVRVFAYNKVGYSQPALAASPQKPMVVPGRPTGVTLQVVSTTELVVLFSPPDDNGGDTIVAYQVEWADDVGFASFSSKNVTLLSGGAPYSCFISGLIKGQKYYVRVRAKNSQGFGQSQDSSPPFLHPHSTPGAPTQVSLGSTSASMLTVQWNVPTDDGGDGIIGFVVQWDISASFDSYSADATTAKITSATERSYTITLLTAGTSYFVRVFATNHAGSGAPQTATPSSLVPVDTNPGKPHTLAVAPTIKTGELSVSWEIPRIPAHGIPCAGTLLVPATCPVFGGLDVVFGGTGFQSYIVHYSTSSDFTGNLTTIVSASPALLTGLVSGTRYYVRVLATNAQGLPSEYCARSNINGYLCPDNLVLLDGTVVMGNLVSEIPI